MHGTITCLVNRLVNFGDDTKKKDTLRQFVSHCSVSSIRLPSADASVRLSHELPQAVLQAVHGVVHCEKRGDCHHLPALAFIAKYHLIE